MPVVVLGLVAFLYVRPISSYLETRDQLAERRAEVLRSAPTGARAPRASSARRASTSSPARRGDRLRPPGEHLFIVKGTAAWNGAHAERVRPPATDA